MTNFEIYSEKNTSHHNKLQFETHLEGLTDSARKLMLELRNYAKSLGCNIIEEVRPHRVVYAKTLTFRTFLDIQPANNSLVISVKSGRNKPITTQVVKTIEDIEAIKKQVFEAYQNI